MSINASFLANKLLSVGLTVANVDTVVAETLSLITAAETVYEGLSGDQKLQAVMAGVHTQLVDLNLADEVDKILHAIKPAISFIVTVLKLTGQLAKAATTVQGSLFSLTHTMSSGGAATPIAGS